MSLRFALTIIGLACLCGDAFGQARFLPTRPDQAATAQAGAIRGDVSGARHSGARYLPTRPQAMQSGRAEYQASPRYLPTRPSQARSQASQSDIFASRHYQTLDRIASRNDNYREFRDARERISDARRKPVRRLLGRVLAAPFKIAFKTAKKAAVKVAISSWIPVL